MTNESVIKVLLADDHVVVRKGLVFVLDTVEDIQVIGEAGSGEEVAYLNKKLRPDIILMDIKMDGMDGIEATQVIIRQNSSTKIIGLSTFFTNETIDAMRKAGACAFLEKNISVSDLADAIYRVNSGEYIFPQVTIEPLDAAYSANNGNEEFTDSLGGQQKKVLFLMIKGFTNPEIAEQLGISVSTARYHVSAILRKLDVSTRSEAVAFSVQNNLINEKDL